MKKLIRKTIYILVILALITPLFNTKNLKATTNQANIELKINKELFLDPDFLYIDVFIDTLADSFKASQISLDMDNEYLNVSQINFNTEFCNVFATSTPSSNSQDFFCFGSLTNQASSTHIATVKLNKKQSGLTSIRLDGSIIMQNSPGPENIFKETEIYNVLLVKKH